MKKFLFLTVLFATMSLSTKMYATCSVGSSSAYCSVSDYWGNDVYDVSNFFLTPYVDVYFNSSITSYGYPGSAGVVAWTDGHGATPADYGSSGVEWTDGLSDTYGTNSSHSGIHWYTGASGWVDLYVVANKGFAYVGASW